MARANQRHDQTPPEMALGVVVAGEKLLDGRQKRRKDFPRRIRRGEGRERRTDDEAGQDRVQKDRRDSEHDEGRDHVSDLEAVVAVEAGRRLPDFSPARDDGVCDGHHADGVELADLRHDAHGAEKQRHARAPVDVVDDLSQERRRRGTLRVDVVVERAEHEVAQDARDDDARVDREDERVTEEKHDDLRHHAVDLLLQLACLVLALEHLVGVLGLHHLGDAHLTAAGVLVGVQAAHGLAVRLGHLRGGGAGREAENTVVLVGLDLDEDVPQRPEEEDGGGDDCRNEEERINGRKDSRILDWVCEEISSLGEIFSRAVEPARVRRAEKNVGRFAFDFEDRRRRSKILIVVIVVVLKRNIFVLIGGFEKVKSFSVIEEIFFVVFLLTLHELTKLFILLVQCFHKL